MTGVELEGLCKKSIHEMYITPSMTLNVEITIVGSIYLLLHQINVELDLIRRTLPRDLPLIMNTFKTWSGKTAFEEKLSS